MHAVTLPKLGQTMEEGTFLEWLIEEGAEFAEGDDIYVVETDKSAVEVSATLSGRLVRKLAQPEDQLEVGALLAIAASLDEEADASDVDSFLERYRQADDLDRDRAMAGTQEERTDRSREEGTATSSSPRATPRAKRMAKENSLDLGSVEGTGKDGAITEADIERHLQTSGGAGAGQPSTDQAAAIRSRHRLTGAAASLARHMTRSWAVPQFTQSMEIDVRPLLDRKNAVQARGSGPGPTVTDFLVDGVINAVQTVPECNATFDGDELVVYDQVDLGLAVATDRGLVVPVLRDAEQDSLGQRSSRLSKLIEDCRADNLPRTAYSGGTITLSNLGMTCVEGGTPLLNPPQVCMIFTGSTIEKPVVRDGKIVATPMMHIVCAYDHRVIDGATGAKFMQALRVAISPVELPNPGST